MPPEARGPGGLLHGWRQMKDGQAVTNREKSPRRNSTQIEVPNFYHVLSVETVEDISEDPAGQTEWRAA